MSRATQPQITQAGEVRSARVESLRALAALGVLMGHIFGQSRHYVPGATLDSFWHRTLLGGGFGVFLFFTLTGYLLFWPFARRYFGSGRPVDLHRYAINRVLRIVPLYVVAVVVLMVLREHGGTASQWWRFMTLSENFSPHTILTLDGPMWSLVVEIHFYVLLPVLAFGLAKATKGSRLRAAAALLALAGASWLAHRHAVGSSGRRLLLEYSLPATFMYFVPGMLLALLRLQWLEKPPQWLRGALCSGDLWLLAAGAFTLLQFRDYSSSTLIAIASFLALGACVLPLRSGRLARLLEWRPLATIGIASYSLYIWHDPIVIWLGGLSGIPHSYAAQVVIGGSLCVAVALISYQLIEVPFLKLRRPWGGAAEPVPGAERQPGEVPVALAG